MCAQLQFNVHEGIGVKLDSQHWGTSFYQN